MSHAQSAKQAEIDRNLEAFIAVRSELAASHSGQHALMRDGTVHGFYGSPLDAQRAGERQFADGLFSVQEISAETSDLGFYSHAVHLWQT